MERNRLTEAAIFSEEGKVGCDRSHLMQPAQILYDPSDAADPCFRPEVLFTQDEGSG
jgi:hypothetical protein